MKTKISKDTSDKVGRLWPEQRTKEIAQRTGYLLPRTTITAKIDWLPGIHNGVLNNKDNGVN